MNNDVLKGIWRQVRGEARKTWGKITDDEFDQVNGEAERLVGVVQTKYGYTREQAEQEVESFINRMQANSR